MPVGQAEILFECLEIVTPYPAEHISVHSTVTGAINVCRTDEGLEPQAVFKGMPVAEADDLVLLAAIETVVAEIIDMQIDRERRLAQIQVRGDLGSAATVVASIVFAPIVAGILKVSKTVEFAPFEAGAAFKLQEKKSPLPALLAVRFSVPRDQSR